MPISQSTIKFLESYFDKIFVVSVPRFTQRHKKVAKNLEGLSFDFFWGTDKLNLSMESAIEDGIYNEAKAKKLQRNWRRLNLGELACSLSHRKIYEEMINNHWAKVLILEDDVLPVDNLAYLPDALMELPANWELVYLGYLKHEVLTPALKRKQLFYKFLASLGLMKWNRTMVNNFLPKPYSTFLKKAGFHDCTHAYAITQEAAKKLLNNQSPIVYRADDLLSYTILRGAITAFVTEPKFFDQEDFHNATLVSEIKK